METLNTHHRKLRLNHSNAIPRYIVAFDTETNRSEEPGCKDRFRHTLRLGTAKYARIVNLRESGPKVVNFNDASIFWELLRDVTGPRHTTWVVGHNIMFDLIQVGMPEKFENGELTVDWPRQKRRENGELTGNSNSFTYLVIDEPTTIIAAKMTRTQGRIVFVDTMNWFPIPLAEIGKSLGIPKLDMPHVDASEDEWFEYCGRDTEITFRCFLGLVQWVRTNDFGMFRYTAPSQAMSAYRHRFMEHNIYPHDVEPIRSLERKAFFGGRSECWRIGPLKETVHQYDVSSFYPYIMMSGKFPVVLDRYEERDDLIELRPNINWYSSCATVLLDTPQAIFPVREKRGVLYPKGEFVTTLCGAELGYAERKGYIKKVGSWASYRCESIFNKWIADLWTMRQHYKQTGDNLYELFTKFLMNSLFGKFAQRSSEWKNDRDNAANLPWSTWVDVDCITDRITNFRSFGWQTQKQCERSEIAGTFIAISAFVTSAGRVLMNEHRRLAGEKNVVYQGVDSLIVNNEGKRRLESQGVVNDHRIGSFRHQLTTDDGILYGAMDYVMGQRIVVAGRPRRIADKDRERDTLRRFEVKGGLFAGRSIDYIAELQFEWVRSGGYWKGDIQKDGSVTPKQLSLFATV